MRNNKMMAPLAGAGGSEMDLFAQGPQPSREGMVCTRSSSRLIRLRDLFFFKGAVWIFKKIPDGQRRDPGGRIRVKICTADI